MEEGVKEDTSWIERVNSEKLALDDKISKLEAFLATKPYPALADRQCPLLRMQLSAMKIYSLALGERLV